MLWGYLRNLSLDIPFPLTFITHETEVTLIKKLSSKKNHNKKVLGIKRVKVNQNEPFLSLYIDSDMSCTHVASNVLYTKRDLIKF